MPSLFLIDTSFRKPGNDCGFWAPLAALLTLYAAPATACTYAPGYEFVQAEAISRDGFFIEGRIVQAFDPVARTPEIVEAKSIFVGEGMPRRFVIARDDDYYAMRRSGIRSPCAGIEYAKVTEQPEFFFLLRPLLRDKSGRDEWVFGEGLANPVTVDAIVSGAKKTGRFRGRPSRRLPGW